MPAHGTSHLLLLFLLLAAAVPPAGALPGNAVAARGAGASVYSCAGAIDYGVVHACALSLADGTPTCLGVNDAAQSSPPPGVLFGAVSAGNEATCGVTIGGDVACWGNTTGAPPAAGGSLPSGGVAAVSVGSGASCVVLSGTGAMRCYGAAAADAPPALSVAGAGFLGVSLGWFHACALQAMVGSNENESAGAVVCWAWGAVLYGPLTGAPQPFERFLALSAGAYTTCAVTASTPRGVACWGADAPVPPPGLPDVEAVATGATHACALTAVTRNAVCFGSNAHAAAGTRLGPFDALVAGT